MRFTGLVAALLCALPLTVASRAEVANAAEARDHLDTVTFGDPASERAHGFAGEATSVVDGAHGQKARVAHPLSPPKAFLGELRFTVAVNPTLRNYFSLKFWGEDSSTYRTVVLVNGEQASYRNGGDYEPINTGTGTGLPGRFFFSTALLPLVSTQGQTKVEITLRTYHPSLSGTATENSRRYHEAIVHTAPELELPARDDTGYAKTTKAAPARSPAEEQAFIDRYDAQQVSAFNALTAKSDASPTATLSIVRYQDELRFYAEALLRDFSPAKTPDDKRLALERIFKSIDNFTRQYYGNVKSLGNGGHQSDWGGYYSALGEALYIVENLIADDQIYGTSRFTDLLSQPFVTGTSDGPNSIAGVDWTGGELTRGEAWERVLKANFDFARSRLSYIYNQVMYTYEGAWKAHEGLRVLGSRFYEGKARSHEIVGESLGWRPFLGEEVLVGPNGADLDLYHSLFQHNRNAVYTDDYLQVVMKGLARSKVEHGRIVRRLPYGRHYTGITRDGLTRENGYVGNYGESANYLPSWFYRTLGHAGDERLNDEILKLALRSVHARGQTRHSSVDANGNRVMVMQQVIDERNSAYPGRVAYATDVNSGPRNFSFASLEKYMADNEARYRGKEWETHWTYAREAVGYLQQQLVDNRVFDTFDSYVLPQHKVDLRLGETWSYVTSARAGYARFGKAAAGVVLPHTDLDRYTDAELARLGIDRSYDNQRFAWVDLDSLLVSARDGATHLYAALHERNKSYLGNGRLHVQHDGYEQLAQVPTQGVLDYREYTLRAPSVEDPIVFDRYPSAPDRPLALAGELAPVAYQPDVGRTNRDNWREDTPYSGYPDLITTRFGEYFVAVNTTRSEYGNERSLTVALPEGVRGDRVFDLVTRRELKVVGGAVRLPPTSAVVLVLGTAEVGNEPPAAVDVVVTTPGSGLVGLTWRPAAGAESYTVSRAEHENGHYRPVATGVTDTSYVDRIPSANGRYFYRITAVNGAGAGRASNAVEAVVTPAHTRAIARTGWRDDVVGAATGGPTTVTGETIAVSGVSGGGFGGGDDSVIVNRDHRDSLLLVSKLATGGTAVSARLGGEGGVMLRDSTAAKARYVYLGADASGALALRTRSLDSHSDIGVGVAGQNATGGVTRSPTAETLTGYTVASHPFVKLVRPAGSPNVTALVSADGQTWTRVGEVAVPMVDVVHAGLAATTAATFTQVRLESLPVNAVVAGGRFNERTGTVSWNKPKAAIAFDLYRTRDPQVAGTDPRGGGAWQTLLDNAFALSHEDTIYGGRMYYKVVARMIDGTSSVTAEPASITAEAFEVVLSRARAVRAQDYTASSFARFVAEVDAAEQASNEPDADESALIKRIYDAYGLLVAVYRDSFEETDQDVWQAAGTGPYVRVVDNGYGRTGVRSLYFASTDTTGNGAYNMSFNSRKQGTSPIRAQPGKAYQVSFWYQLTDYRPGSGVGAYYFIRSHDGTAGVGTEQRNWLPAGDTPAGEWKYFERTYTTVTDASVDNVAIDFGFRGSAGEFRVDDLLVEPADG